MNYAQALIASEYNPKGVIEALEELKVKCPRCAGDGIKLSGGVCPRCDGNKKIHYSHSLQVGEWCIKDGRLTLVGQTFDKYRGYLIPILEWETIEDILKRAGILLRLRQTPDGWVPPTKFYCDVTILHRDAARVKEFISLSVADSRIKAVYDAVLKLKKEKK